VMRSSPLFVAFRPHEGEILGAFDKIILRTPCHDNTCDGLADMLIKYSWEKMKSSYTMRNPSGIQ
jgi:hypothetical protein